MLDVHAPEHNISGTRDFFIHLFTITVGLLIALGLENAAEAMHHHHQRKEAEASIRAELAQNRDDMLKGAPQLKKEFEDMKLVLAFVEARSMGEKTAPPQKLAITFQQAPLPDAAWRTAASTGALAYMNYDEVQRFAAAYKEQEMLETASEKALDDYSALGSILLIGPTPEALTKEQAAEALPFVRQAISHLCTMAAVGNGAIEGYKEALQ